MPKSFRMKLLLAVALVNTVAVLYWTTWRRGAEVKNKGSEASGCAAARTGLARPGCTVAAVPKLLHFTYKDPLLPADYLRSLRHCAEVNKDWLPVLWTDAGIRLFVRRRFPHLEHVFYGFPHKIQRADAVRYLILYVFGGVYMDLDMTCVHPLEAAIDYIGCFLDKEREHQTQVLHHRPFSAMNSAMGCTSRHPFFEQVIRYTLSPQRLKAKFIFPKTILETTGPAMLTHQFKLWVRAGNTPAVVLLNETHFSPKIDPGSAVYGTCRSVARRLRHSPPQSISEAACQQLAAMGFERSDELFVTNRTAAIHGFTHQGYFERSPGANAFAAVPQLCNYTELLRLSEF